MQFDATFSRHDNTKFAKIIKIQVKHIKVSFLYVILAQTEREYHNKQLISKSGGRQFDLGRRDIISDME